MVRTLKDSFVKSIEYVIYRQEKDREFLCSLSSFLTSTASASTEAILFCRYASHARLDIFALRQIRYVFALLKLDMI